MSKLFRTLLALNLALVLVGSTPLAAGNAFFVTGKVLGGAEAALGTATIVRDLIPGEPAFQIAGPDPLYPNKLLSRPSYGAYFLTDAGSQWATGLATGQSLLAVAEVITGMNGWSGNPALGWIRTTLSKADKAAGMLSFQDTQLLSVPAPALLTASASQVQLVIPSMPAADAINYSLWSREAGSTSWAYLQSLPIPAAGQVGQVLISQVQAGKSYHYGLSVEIPWAGGSGAGARPSAQGIFVSSARSDVGPIYAADHQPLAAKTEAAAHVPTPTVAEGWAAYPNPATGKRFEVSFEAKDTLYYKVIVYSLEGSMSRVLSGHVSQAAWQKVGVNIEGLASGIYLVQLRVKTGLGPEIEYATKKLAILH